MGNKAKSSRGMKASAPKPAPSAAELRDRIAAKAYEIYLMRGGSPGHHQEDWLEAEQLIMVEFTQDNGGKKTRKSPPRPPATSRSAILRRRSAEP